jgi:hypothetical protein
VLDEALALRRLGSRTRAICAAAPTAAGFA